jgi:signal transduction histidine kinase
LLLEKKWAKKNLDLSLDFDEYKVVANEDMLKQVWFNLLDNAIKFANDGGSLSVYIENCCGSLSVAIENSGSTIKESEYENIFNKFYRLDDTNTKEGNGIGLSIVKHIINLHDGKISVLSKDNKTTFTVALPLRKNKI